MEQKPYSFKHFSKWFTAIERKKTDYRKLFYRRLGRKGGGCREAFVRACERLSKLDFAALVNRGSIIREGR